MVKAWQSYQPLNSSLVTAVAGIFNTRRHGQLCLEFFACLMKAFFFIRVPAAIELLPESEERRVGLSLDMQRCLAFRLMVFDTGLAAGPSSRAFPTNTSFILSSLLLKASVWPLGGEAVQVLML